MSRREGASRAVGITFLSVFSLIPCAALALGKPDWAKPYLDWPSPSGSYIAQADEWAIVYGEIEFALNGCCIEERHRYILENRTGRPLAFSAAISYDAELQDLRDVALNVQKAVLWHTINLKNSAAELSVTGQSTIVVAGAEEIPGHHRVVWEYVLAGRFDFPCWQRLGLPRHFPAGQICLKLAAGAAEGGLTLEMQNPTQASLPSSFSRGLDGSWTVKELPAASKLNESLFLQPEYPQLYPTVVVSAAKNAAATWAGFLQKYREAWASREADLDKAALSAKAAALAGGLQKPYEQVARLGRFVQHDVYYDDSNEQGLDAWLPLKPENSLRSMKADCKGKAILLKSLLSTIQIDSVPVLLLRSQRFSAWGDVPSTAEINHVILAVRLPGTELDLPATLVEGPAKGWVLFDPTDESVSFGEPPAGLERVPALFVGAWPDGRSVIRTKVPAAGRTRVSITAKLDALEILATSVEAEDNGDSALVVRLGRLFDEEKRRKRFLESLSSVVSQPSLKRLSLEGPPDGVPGGIRLSADWVTSRAVQPMTSAKLLANPLAVAATLQGIPNGVPQRHTPLPEDRVELAPPWDARLCTQGEDSVLEVQVELTLPAGVSLTPPAAREESRPWIAYGMKWSDEGHGLWKARIRLEMRRGEWPAAQRKESLQLLDRIYMALYEPLLLKTDK